MIEKAHEAKTLVAVAADIMSLLLLSSHGSQGADAVVGNFEHLGRERAFAGRAERIGLRPKKMVEYEVLK